MAAWPWQCKHSAYSAAHPLANTCLSNRKRTSVPLRFPLPLGSFWLARGAAATPRWNVWLCCCPSRLQTAQLLCWGEQGALDQHVSAVQASLSGKEDPSRLNSGGCAGCRGYSLQWHYLAGPSHETFKMLSVSTPCRSARPCPCHAAESPRVQHYSLNVQDAGVRLTRR